MTAGESARFIQTRPLLAAARPALLSTKLGMVLFKPKLNSLLEGSGQIIELSRLFF
jgi:hypothetical protein